MTLREISELAFSEGVILAGKTSAPRGGWRNGVDFLSAISQEGGPSVIAESSAAAQVAVAGEQPAGRPSVTAGQWLEAGIGFVVPTAAVLWGIWSVWRWVSPDLAKSTRIVPGVAEFALICVLVILIVLGWEVFKAWRQPQRTLQTRMSGNQLPLSRR